MTFGRKLRKASGLFAIAFGALTIATGSTTLLGALEMGAVVRFVLWFNTLAGGAYMVAGLGLWQGKRWAFPLALAIFAATLVVFAAFGLHVARGGLFEMRTVFAMALRSTIWGAIALVAHRTLPGQGAPLDPKSSIFNGKSPK